MTAGTLIARTLKLLGVLGAGETADADDALDTLDTLNDMVSGWKLDRLWIHALARTEKALAAGTASYTIGSGGDINVERPVWIDSALIIQDPTADTPTELPLEVLTDQRWQGISAKSLSGQPTALFYDRAWTAGLGRVYPWPVPSAAGQTLALYLPAQPASSFADLTTDYTFPPGYQRALRYNLGREIAGEFGTALTPEQTTIAVDSLADIRRANQRPVELTFDRALTANSGGHSASDLRAGLV